MSRAGLVGVTESKSGRLRATFSTLPWLSAIWRKLLCISELRQWEADLQPLPGSIENCVKSWNRTKAFAKLGE